MARRLIGLDFETHYDSKFYTLRKMDIPSYICDPRFEATLVAVKEGHDPAFIVDGPDIPRYLQGLGDPKNITLYGHNLMFDACIASWIYGWRAGLNICTLALARQTIQAYCRSLSLKSVLEYLHLPAKGGFLSMVDGMRRDDIIAAGFWQQYCDYAVGDIDGAYGIYQQLAPLVPPEEHVIADMVLRMATEPSFDLDQPLLQAHLDDVIEKKKEMLAFAMIGGSLRGKEDLMSNDKFALVLQSLGIDPPTKTSPVTGRQAWAFAKSDEGMKELLEHPDPVVQAVVAARLGHKTTLEETRTARFLNCSTLTFPAYGVGKFPVPLKVSGAHTHRLSGDWKYNAQNMRRGGKLRKSLKAPPGHTVVVGDEKQIEARMAAEFSGQADLVEQFRLGVDTYAAMATKIFGFVVDRKIHVPQGFVGKTCLGADTLVLTDSGWKPILYVSASDKVWDGMAWVTHQGLIYQGVKPALTKYGVTATSDHEISLGSSWLEWSAVCADRRLFQSAVASVRLPCSATSTTNEVGTQSANASVGERAASTGTTSKAASQLGAVNVWARSTLRTLHCTATSCLTMLTDAVSPTASGPALTGATTQRTGFTAATAGEAYTSTKHGVPTSARSCPTCSRARAGMTRLSTWIEQITRRVTNRATLGSLPPQATTKTEGRFGSCSFASTNLKPVYDIANAGPRHRFTILTDEGPLVVSNCVLSGMYGVGPPKFRSSVIHLSQEQTGTRIDVDVDLGPSVTSETIIEAYRRETWAITEMRKRLNNCIPLMAQPDCNFFVGAVQFLYQKIRLPNGHYLYYNKLRYDDTSGSWIYEYAGRWKRIYGGALLENIIQALARIVTMHAALRLRPDLIKYNWKLALQAHDELVLIVPDDHVNYAKQRLKEELTRQVTWMPNLPVDADIGSGPTYGDAK